MPDTELLHCSLLLNTLTGASWVPCKCCPATHRKTSATKAISVRCNWHFWSDQNLNWDLNGTTFLENGKVPLNIELCCLKLEVFSRVPQYLMWSNPDHKVLTTFDCLVLVKGLGVRRTGIPFWSCHLLSNSLTSSLPLTFWSVKWERRVAQTRIILLFFYLFGEVERSGHPFQGAANRAEGWRSWNVLLKEAFNTGFIILSEVLWLNFH